MSKHRLGKLLLVVSAAAFAACSKKDEASPSIDAGHKSNQALASGEQQPPWAVPHGEEHWRRSSTSVKANQDPKGELQLPAELNIGDIVDRVSHAFRADESNSSRVTARRFRAHLGSQGLELSPHRPANADMAPGNQHDRDDLGEPVPDPTTEFHLRTVSVTAGEDEQLRPGRGARGWHVFGNTGQTLLNARYGIVEHYEVRERGVETVWFFRERPEGAGKLTVSVEVEGLTYAGETSGGLHFADTDGVERVRVGRVTVVDSQGSEWPVPMTFAHNRLTVDVPANVVAKATFPIAIDPLVGIEFGMDHPLGGSGRWWADIACDGTRYLAVWEERKTGNAEIFGTLIAKAQTSTMDHQPAVDCIQGNGCLVAWMRTNGTVGIYAAKVTNTNTVTQLGALSTNAGGDVGVTAGGSGYLVVWNESDLVKQRFVYSNNTVSSTTFDAYQHST